MGRQSQKWVRMHELRNFAGLRRTTKLLGQTFLILTFWPRMWPKFHPCRWWSDPCKLRPHSRPNALQKKVLAAIIPKRSQLFLVQSAKPSFPSFLFFARSAIHVRGPALTLVCSYFLSCPACPRTGQKLARPPPMIVGGGH